MARRGRVANAPETVHFQLLLRTAGGEPAPAPVRASTADIARYRPDPGAAPAVIAWLAKHGVVAHDAGFAIAASAPRATFTRLFGQRGASRAPSVPAALAAWVSAVEPSVPPELFR
ncbi:MAG: hypothetical protein KIT17_27715 [Rubrivivax sp.]|nr:hypothetical protein [Rubrivivax sp.]